MFCTVVSQSTTGKTEPSTTEEADINASNDNSYSGWSRNISPADTDGGLSSEGDWSRMCTEDVCPKVAKNPTVRSPSQPRSIELVLAGDSGSSRTTVTDMEDVVIDLRKLISEATGVALSSVELLMNNNGRVLLDHELIPSPVTVKGLDRFPSGSVLLGRGHFLQVLLDLRNGIAAAQGEEQPQEDPTTTPLPEDDENDIAEKLVLRVLKKQNDLAQRVGVAAPQATFQGVSDINSFYRTTIFNKDDDFRSVYSEINALLGHPNSTFFEFLGTDAERGLIGA